MWGARQSELPPAQFFIPLTISEVPMTVTTLGKIRFIVLGWQEINKVRKKQADNGRSKTAP